MNDEESDEPVGFKRPRKQRALVRVYLFLANATLISEILIQSNADWNILQVISEDDESPPVEQGPSNPEGPQNWHQKSSDAHVLWPRQHKQDVWKPDGHEVSISPIHM